MGGLKGNSRVKSVLSLNLPPAKGEPGCARELQTLDMEYEGVLDRA